MDFSKLAPAEKRDVFIYKPYYSNQDQNKQNVLPFALTLYRQESLEGERSIEGGKNIPFLATWFASNLPADLTRCRLQFDNNAELGYEVTLPNHEFIGYLSDLLVTYKRNKQTDFPISFYRKLLQYEI
ncbi:type IV pilus biogenesis protein EbsA [Prochlorothrix hollandica]|uniref:Uncharacterized protein n=1 Tax=Prochlorothrix hollandica PCC 9006 = CALU 1027 TaxID=317619 RepID=A0A0M2PY91_PROHO|nr:type IV pilus biogenesis protein EbsA [Prochlorothrix hollandica]KKJ01140.1 hypothetical protein PROH_01725 [Prochlorothrix hollandica PCC 9006 = CALU 1027]